MLGSRRHHRGVVPERHQRGPVTVKHHPVPRLVKPAAVLAAALALIVTSATGAVAEPDPPGIPVPTKPLSLVKAGVSAEGRSAGDGKVSVRLLADGDARHSVFVRFNGRSAAEVNSDSRAEGAGRTTSARAARTRQEQIGKASDSVAALARRADGKARQLFSIGNALAGVAVRTDRAGIRAMARRGDVASITPLGRYRVETASADVLTRALKTWRDSKLAGSGVKVGVMDTGIDYTHADFGGPGTKAAYAAAAAADTQSGWQTKKVVGGWDFVGNDYDADDDDPVIAPDSNPLDCEGDGHGTHVAGIAAGYGVNGNGTTYTGSYGSLTSAKLKAMRIGPGTAPRASLYALRVFGCAGTTDMVMPALDWALDPNGDGDFADHLDVLNMSLGSDYEAPDVATNLLIDTLASHGVMTVNAAGNAGDYTDAGSAAGRSLTVGSSVDEYSLLDGLIVDAPAKVAGKVAGQVSADYPWATEPDVTGRVAALSSRNSDGCKALSRADAAKVAGKVAWLEWDENDASRRCGSVVRSANVKAAGAIGALFTTNGHDFSGGISGDATIPVFQLNLKATSTLRSAAAAGTLRVTFTNRLLASVKSDDSKATDLLSGFSSRGTHGAPGTLKPDVTAPGSTIVSAGVATGNRPLSMSGTSMSTPHVAGIAALVRGKHPTWSVTRVKAAIMNTAVHDLYTGAGKTGRRYGPNRVGAGRVDAAYATTTSVVAYNAADPGLVSAGFGVVEAPITASTVKKTARVAVRNLGSKSQKVTLSYAARVSQPGVSYSVSPRSVTVKGNSSRTVTVTMTIKPSALRRSLDPTMSATTISSVTGKGDRQFVADASGNLLVKPSGKTSLRVPVHGAAKPVSVTKASVGRTAITLGGKGFAQGSGRSAFVSKASLLTLGATSPRLPTCVLGQVSGCALGSTARSSDLRYTGAGYVQTGRSPGEGLLWFGVTMWGNAPILGGGRETDVAIDVDGDQVTDYVVAAFTPADSDQPIALLVDAAGNPISAYPINFLAGGTDTNAYDSDSFLIPVWAEDIGVDPDATSYPISYRTYSFSEAELDGGALDSTGWVSHDVVDPAVKTDDALYLDRAGAKIRFEARAQAPVVTPDATARPRGAEPAAATTVKALLIHLNGASGKRAEVLKLPA